MKRFTLSIFLTVILILFAACSSSNEKADENDRDPKNEENIASIKKDSEKGEVKIKSLIKDQIPSHWSINNTHIRPKEKMDFYSTSFKGKVTRVENNYLSVSKPGEYYRFQINVIKAQNDEEAKKIFDHLTSISSKKEKYILSGDKVYEVLAKDKLIDECRSIFSE